jgi:PHP family Zn ribbon phosphoesterase
MSIPVACPSCAAKFHAADEAAGKTAHCPKCGSPIPVPVPPRPLATQKQKDYARALGAQFPENIDRKAIGKLIDQAVTKRDEERFRQLDDLERREAVASEGLRLADATSDEIVKALYERGLTAVLITFQTNEIVDFEHLTGVTGSYSFTDNMAEEDMESVILTAATPFLYKRWPFLKSMSEE